MKISEYPLGVQTARECPDLNMDFRSFDNGLKQLNEYKVMLELDNHLDEYVERADSFTFNCLPIDSLLHFLSKSKFQNITKPCLYLFFMKKNNYCKTQALHRLSL